MKCALQQMGSEKRICLVLGPWTPTVTVTKLYFVIFFYEQPFIICLVIVSWSSQGSHAPALKVHSDGTYEEIKRVEKCHFFGAVPSFLSENEIFSGPRSAHKC